MWIRGTSSFGIRAGISAGDSFSSLPSLQVRTTQLSRAVGGGEQPPALPRTKALLTLPTPRQRELGHMMGARWQV